MKKFGLLAPLVLMLMALLSTPALQAQLGPTGALLGVVEDSTGAVIVGAEVTVTQPQTGLTRTALTDVAGNFGILTLPIGSYSVSVSMKGFKVWRLARAELRLSERKRLSPFLEVGDFTENITVEAAAELLQTEKSSVEAVVVQKQIRDLNSSSMV
jgi:hypothetical protein